MASFANGRELFTDNLPLSARVLNVRSQSAEPHDSLTDDVEFAHLDADDALTFVDETAYDGIWVGSSLTRVPPVKLLATLTNLRRYLSPGGFYGGLFLTAPGDRVLVQTINPRVLYPAALLLKLHRQAGLKPLTVAESTSDNGEDGLFVLAG